VLKIIVLISAVLLCCNNVANYYRQWHNTY